MRQIKKVIAIAVLSLILASTAYAAAPVKVGIVMPADVQAMHEIIAGFKQTLQKEYSHPIEFEVANAQSDANLQHAILMQMRDQNYNLIVPIGDDATQMAVATNKQQPILGLAADLSDADRAKLNPCNVAIVDDEVSDAKILEFVHAAYPQLKKIALVHSAADKIFPEVAQVKQEASGMGIEVKDVMTATLPDMQSAVKELPSDIQAIFVLKDALIVSGIPQLVQIAKQRQIPLITSDDGSVQNGAGFAVGVHESEIGQDGGLLAAQILDGKAACNLPITKMTKLTVFINKQAMASSGQNIETVINTAKQLNYKVELLSAK